MNIAQLVFLLLSGASYISISATAFIVIGKSRTLTNAFLSPSSLIVEPDGGVELIPIDTIDARMKNMGAVDGLSGKDGPAYDYWMSAQVKGRLISDFRSQIVKDASKKANFPGFRKGQIPPYAQPKMTAFALQEGIVKTAESVVAAFGLKALDGSAGDMQVQEDIQQILKSYKVGEDVSFTATLKCEFDPLKVKPSAEAVIETAAEDVSAPATEPE